MTLVELVPERVAAGGDAVAREASGRVVFVHGALPGERVRARLTDERPTFARAETVEVLEAAAGRRDPPCPLVAAGCGGCGWQHVDSATQLALKEAIVVEALLRIGGLLDVEVLAGPALDPFGFRTTLRLGVGDDGRAGLREHRSHRLVPIDHCLVAHPLLDALLADARFPGATEVTLRCGASTGERVASTRPAGAALQAVLAPDVRVGPDAHHHEVVAGQRLRVSGGSFFQTRADGAGALVAEVQSAAGERLGDGVVVDAYGGVGLFAATVARHGEVVVVESSRSACADARENLDSSSATVVCADVARWRPTDAALVVADPTRTGLGKAAAAVLAATGASRLVLVSCDPVSLARDAGLLDGLGYTHVRSTLVDLFPQTPHIEVVTRFDLR